MSECHLKNGECVRCGECCQRFQLEVDPEKYPQIADTMLKTFNANYPFKLKEVKKFLWRFYGVCEHFDEETKLCKIYENRPELCRVSFRRRNEFGDSVKDVSKVPKS